MQQLGGGGGQVVDPSVDHVPHALGYDDRVGPQASRLGHVAHDLAGVEGVTRRLDVDGARHGEKVAVDGARRGGGQHLGDRVLGQPAELDPLDTRLPPEVGEHSAEILREIGEA